MERGVYKVIGINPEADQKWSAYLRSMLAFSAVSVLFLYGLQRLQHYLLELVGPHMAPVPPATALNTAASFVTNTNWQNYSGESTMTYLVQMGGLAVQNFMSAAVGIVIAIAMIRGFTRSRTDKLGNFWVDVTRCVFRLLLPLAVVGVHRLHGRRRDRQLQRLTTRSPPCPAGTRPWSAGRSPRRKSSRTWGTTAAASSTPTPRTRFENPNPFTNWFTIFVLLLIPFATPRAFGKMVGDNRQGLRAASRSWWSSGSSPSAASASSRPAGSPGRPRSSRTAPWKASEVRFGTPGSSLFAASTTVTSTGSVNSLP